MELFFVLLIIVLLVCWYSIDRNCGPTHRLKRFLRKLTGGGGNGPPTKHNERPIQLPSSYG